MRHSEHIQATPTIPSELSSFGRKWASRARLFQRSSYVGVGMFARLPESIQCRVLEQALNHALKQLVREGEFDFLSGRSCKIQFIDRGPGFNISYNGKNLIVSKQQSADVCISATLSGFLKLIAQQSDPDTLFFDRELLLEGDTALGLHIKNQLDSVTEDHLPIPWKQLLEAFRKLLQYESKIPGTSN